MSDTNPAEKPVNDGGGSAPQPDPPPDGQEASAAGAEKPVNDGGGS